MLSVIVPYFAASLIFIAVLFFLLKRSPSGWEDEQGFHVAS